MVARVRARENEQHDVLGAVQTFVNAHMQASPLHLLQCSLLTKVFYSLDSLASRTAAHTVLHTSHSIVPAPYRCHFHQFSAICQAVQDTCSKLQEGMSFKGKYSMQSHGWQVPAYVLCSGHRTTDRRQHMSVKLFARGMDYLQEKALLETPTVTLQQYLPGNRPETSPVILVWVNTVISFLLVQVL